MAKKYVTKKTKGVFLCRGHQGFLSKSDYRKLPSSQKSRCRMIVPPGRPRKRRPR